MANGIFNTEQRLLRGHRETIPGEVEVLADSDGDVRVRSVELSTLEVEYDDTSSKYLTGDHTHDEAIAGVARATIDSSIKFAPGEFIFNPAGTPATEGIVSEYTVTDAGSDSNLSAGTYALVETTNFTTDSLAGTGLELEIIIPGIIGETELTITAGGQDYLVGDVITITVIGVDTIDTPMVLEVSAITDTGGTLVEGRLPYMKYLEAAGLVVTESEPTDENTEDGYWQLVPAIAGDSQTITTALYDIETGTGNVGIEYKIAGAMSTLTIDSESAGKPFMANFSMQGKVSDVSQVENVDIPTFDDDNALSTLADKMLNTFITITEINQDGSDAGNTPVSFCVNKFGLDTGSTIAEIMCQADAYGIKHYTITQRDPRVTIDPLLVKLTDFNFWSALNSEKVYKLEIISYEDATKTKVFLSIEVPIAQIVEASGSDDNGFRRNALTLRPLRNKQAPLTGATGVVTRENDYIIKIGSVNTTV